MASGFNNSRLALFQMQWQHPAIVASAVIAIGRNAASRLNHRFLRGQSQAAESVLRIQQQNAIFRHYPDDHNHAPYAKRHLNVVPVTSNARNPPNVDQQAPTLKSSGGCEKVLNSK